MAPSRRIYDHLPIYTRISDSINLVEKICDSFQQGYYNVEDILENLYLYLDPDLAPSEYLPWLGQLVGLFPLNDSAIGTGIPEAWDDKRKRYAIKQAQNFFKRKGTFEGVKLGYRIWLFQDKVFETDLILLKSKGGKIHESNNPRKITDLPLEYDNFNIDYHNFGDLRYWKNSQNTIVSSNNKSINRYTNELITNKYNQNQTNIFDLNVTLNNKSIEEGSYNFDKLNLEILPSSTTPNPILWFRNLTKLDIKYLENESLLNPAHKSKNWILTIYTSNNTYTFNPLWLFFFKLNDNPLSWKQSILESENITEEKVNNLNNFFINLDLAKQYKTPFYNESNNYNNLALQFIFYSEYEQSIYQIRLDIVNSDNENSTSTLLFASNQDILLTPHHITGFEFIIPYQHLNFLQLNAIANNVNNFNILGTSIIHGVSHVQAEPSISQSFRQGTLDVIAEISQFSFFFANANTIRLNVNSEPSFVNNEAEGYLEYNIHVISSPASISGTINLNSNNTLIVSSGNIDFNFEQLKVLITGSISCLSSPSSVLMNATDETPFIIENMEVISESAEFIGSGTYIRNITLDVIAENSEFVGESIQTNPGSLELTIENHPEVSILEVLNILDFGNSTFTSEDGIHEFNTKIVIIGTGSFTSLNSAFDGTATTS